jgi:hypothetical protein
MTASKTITSSRDSTATEPERIWFLGGLVTVHIPAEAGLGFSLVESFVPRDSSPRYTCIAVTTKASICWTAV